MTLRLCIVLGAAAALLGAAAPARADNAQVLTAVIKWSAVMEKDGGALGTAVDKGPAQADVAALRLRRDALAAAVAVKAVKPSSAVGVQVRDLLVQALGKFQLAGQELHLAVLAANKNDAGGANSHAGKATRLATVGGKLLTQTATLIRKLKP